MHSILILEKKTHRKYVFQTEKTYKVSSIISNKID